MWRDFKTHGFYLGEGDSQKVVFIREQQLVLIFGGLLYVAFGLLYKYVNEAFYDPLAGRLIVASGFWLLAFAFQLRPNRFHLITEISFGFGFVLLGYLAFLMVINDFNRLYLWGFDIIFLLLAIDCSTKGKLRFFVLIGGLLILVPLWLSSVKFENQVFYTALFLLSAWLAYQSVKTRIDKEVSLDNQRAFTEEIFKQEKDGVLIFNQDSGELIAGNNSALRFFHGDYCQKIGDLESVLQANTLECDCSKDANAGLFTTVPSEQQRRIKTPNNNERWIELNMQEIRAKDAAYNLLKIKDIDGKKRAQEALADSEASYRLLAENATDVIAMHQLDGTFTYASPQAEQVIGYKPEELQSYRIQELADHSQDYMPDDLSVALHGNQTPTILTYCMKDKAKGYQWLETTLRKATSEEAGWGQGEVAVSVTRDITQRKAIENQLKRQEAVMQELATVVTNHLMADNYNNGIHRLLQTIVENCNFQLAEVFQLKEVNESPVAQISHAWNYLDGALSTDESSYQINYSEDFFSQLKQGKLLAAYDNTGYALLADRMQVVGSIRTITAPILHGEQLIGFCTMYNRALEEISDLEEKAIKIIASSISSAIVNKEANEALINAKEEAEIAAKAKADFLATMSHEIRTPLNAVIGMTNLLIDTPLTEEQREYVDTVKLSGSNLLDLINEILDFSKIESGQLSIQQTTFNLYQSVENALELMGSAAAKQDLELSYFISSDIPNQIEGDSLRLRQVLVNLVNNAIKFTYSGGVCVYVTLLSSETKVLNLQFEVQDTGEGIPDDQQRKLFEAFEQGTSAVANQQKGTGLGLAIAKRLVELMGGTIWFTSKLNKGTSFFFTIQAHSSSESVKELENPAKDLGLKPHPVGLVGKPYGALNQVYHNLYNFGLKPFFISQEVEAVKVSESSLVILDASQVRKNERLQVITGSLTSEPLIVLGYPNEHKDQLSPLKKNPDQTINKPVKKDVLHQAVKQVLAEASTTANDASPTSASSIPPTLGTELPIRILVAEDNFINQKLIIRVLEKMGFKPDLADNGDEVLKFLGKNNYDLILMDVQMPEKDGIETTKAIRADHLHQPAIIALTAAAQETDHERCLKAGMNDFISKPMNFEKLEALIRKWGYSIKD